MEEVARIRFDLVRSRPVIRRGGSHRCVRGRQDG